MKVLMVGLGSAGQRHVRNLRALLGSEVEFLAYRVRKLSRVLTTRMAIEPESDVEQKYQIHAYSSLDQALARKPDAVFVCNPNSLHIPVALEAARAGCHLFIEKPLSHTFEGVQELLDVVERQRLTALVGFQLRFHPCLLKLQTLLQAQAIGRVVAVKIEKGEYLPGFHGYEDYRQMTESRRTLGGGVVLCQIHELDYLSSLFGLPQRVFALGGHLSNLEVDVEDVTSILMDFSFDGRSLPVHVHLDFVQRPPSRTCEIIGDEGKILIDFQIPTVLVYNGQGKLAEKHIFETFEKNQLFLDELKHFLACLRGEQQPIVPIHEGIRSLRIALAIKESLKNRQVVEL